MLSGHEPLENLTKAGEKLSHVHISHTLPDMSKRILPRSGDGENYAEYINLLKDMNYAGDISIEAWGNDLEKEGRAAVGMHKALCCDSLNTFYAQNRRASPFSAHYLCFKFIYCGCHSKHYTRSYLELLPRFR